MKGLGILFAVLACSFAVKGVSALHEALSDYSAQDIKFMGASYQLATSWVLMWLSAAMSALLIGLANRFEGVERRDWLNIRTVGVSCFIMAGLHAVLGLLAALQILSGNAFTREEAEMMVQALVAWSFFVLSLTGFAALLIGIDKFPTDKVATGKLVQPDLIRRD